MSKKDKTRIWLESYTPVFTTKSKDEVYELIARHKLIKAHDVFGVEKQILPSRIDKVESMQGEKHD